MDLSHFPERFRARILAGLVRTGRAGLRIRFEKLEGEVLALRVDRSPEAPEVSDTLCTTRMEELTRTNFAGLPYKLRIRVEE